MELLSDKEFSLSDARKFLELLSDKEFSLSEAIEVVELLSDKEFSLSEARKFWNSCLTRSLACQRL